MTVHAQDGPGTARHAAAPGRADVPQGQGWLSFAAIMLAIIGLVNFVYGIAAIDNANFYVADAQFVISDLSTWGWAIMLTGLFQLAVAIAIPTRNQIARWLGVAFVGLNMIAQLMMIPAFPLWALAIFAVDVLIVYGLVLYGDRETELA